MLGTVRRQLALIRYYSAPQRLSAWTKAADLALILSLVPALLTVWTLDSTAGRVVDTAILHGRLAREADGTIYAWFIGADEIYAPWQIPNGYGTFMFVSDIREYGVPIATTERLEKPRLDLDLFLESGPTKQGVVLPADSELRLAIDEALRLSGQRKLLTAWLTDRSFVERRRLSWMASTVTWWFAWGVASVVVVQVTRLLSFLVARKRAARRAGFQMTLQCYNCGYDLRGSEFSDRCPECGALTH